MAELYLVEFKGSRKSYFLNKFYHKVAETDWVVTQAERGEDIGRVLKKIDSEMGFEEAGRPRSILRKANNEDMSRHQSLVKSDNDDRPEVVTMVRQHGLSMKVVDIETQFDGNKMTIFFTADHRVDFRGLVKDMASRFKTRIELRQIGVRDEARRIGGYGICGIRQCCNTFINEFKPITTTHAREQDLPMNPSKISGNCGRLLCCLRFESETYKRVKGQFPVPGTPVETKDGSGIVERIDIFNEEAMVRDTEGILFRVSAKDILDRKKGKPKKSIMAQLEEESYQVPVDKGELRKLDDKDDVD